MEVTRRTEVEKIVLSPGLMDPSGHREGEGILFLEPQQGSILIENATPDGLREHPQ